MNLCLFFFCTVMVYQHMLRLKHSIYFVKWIHMYFCTNQKKHPLSNFLRHWYQSILPTQLGLDCRRVGAKAPTFSFTVHCMGARDRGRAALGLPKRAWSFRFHFQIFCSFLAGWISCFLWLLLGSWDWCAVYSVLLTGTTAAHFSITFGGTIRFLSIFLSFLNLLTSVALDAVTLFLQQNGLNWPWLLQLKDWALLDTCRRTLCRLRRWLPGPEHACFFQFLWKTGFRCWCRCCQNSWQFGEFCQFTCLAQLDQAHQDALGKESSS